MFAGCFDSLHRESCLSAACCFGFFGGKGRNNCVQWKMMVLECEVSADLKKGRVGGGNEAI